MKAKPKNITNVFVRYNLHITPVIIALFVSFSLMSAGANAQSDFYKKYFPSNNTIVFLPGILGSKIWIDGDVVWGGSDFDSPKLFYSANNAGAKIRTEALSQIEISKLFDVNRIVYGNFLTEMSIKHQEGGRFVSLSYDWRASNRLSAERIAREICDKQLQHRNGVIFVAHSMGGLVLKHWFLDHYEKGCNGKKLNINSIVYVATPHLGSPKALWSFIVGPKLHWAPILNNYVTKGIYKYGSTFDSTYELIPAELAYNGSFSYDNICVSKSVKSIFDRGRRPSFYQIDDNDQPIPTDIFNAVRWKEYGLVDKYQKLFGKKVGLDFFQRKLDSARENICRISKFIAPEELKEKVHILHGRLMESSKKVKDETVTNIFVKVSSNKFTETAVRKQKIKTQIFSPDKKKFFNFGIEQGVGDQTVPIISGLMGRCNKLCNAIDVNANHEAIMEGVDLAEVLQELQIASIEDDTKRKTELKEYANFIVNSEGGRSGTILREQLGAEWSNAYVDAAVNKTIAKYGLEDPNQGYRLAKANNDVVGMVAWSKTEELNSVKRSWAANNAGYIAFQNGQYGLAETMLKDAIKISFEIDNPEQRKAVKAKAANSLGMTYLNTQDPERAREMFELSAQLGHQRALANLNLVDAGLATEPEPD